MNQWKGVNNMPIYPNASPCALSSLPTIFSKVCETLESLEDIQDFLGNYHHPCFVSVPFFQAELDYEIRVWGKIYSPVSIVFRITFWTVLEVKEKKLQFIYGFHQRTKKTELFSNRHISPKQNGMVSASYEKKQYNTLTLLLFPFFPKGCFNI